MSAGARVAQSEPTASVSQRVMEPDSMDTLEEVVAYDGLTLKYLRILHNGFIETAVNASPAGGRFLEVGSGTGRISIGVATHSPDVEVLGIDLSATMRTVARENAREAGVADRVAYEPGDANKLPFADGSFDAVFCHNMLHHVAEPLVVVKEISRVVKADGAVLIRDLVRVASFLVPFHVNLLGLTYTRLMKKEYRDSIRAALSPQEWRALYQESGISGVRLTRQFITHQGIERPASNRRGTHTQIPTPFHLRPLKSMYVSRYQQSVDRS